MPLEIATLISDLVPANPDHNDNLGNVDSHVRVIKATLKATFPNVTAPIQSTASQIDANILSPARLAALEAASNKLTGNQTVTGNVVAAGSINAQAGGVYEFGNRVVPFGLITLWFGLLTNIPAGWQLCNGANGTPDLRDRFVVGAGANYPVYQTGGSGSVSSTTGAGGAHNHTGVATPAGSHTHTAGTDIQGVHSHGGATQAHVLAYAEMPAHSHTFQTHGGPPVSDRSDGDFCTGGSGYNTIGTSTEGSNFGHAHFINADGGHGHNVSVSAVGDHVHGIPYDPGHSHGLSFDIRPPYSALCYIMKMV